MTEFDANKFAKHVGDRLENIEHSQETEATRVNQLHMENQSALQRVESAVNQIQRILASIVGEPGTNIDGRLGTMQQNLKETEARLKGDIKDVEIQQTKLELKVDTMANELKNMWRALALGAMAILFDVIWRFVDYLLHAHR